MFSRNVWLSIKIKIVFLQNSLSPMMFKNYSFEDVQSLSTTISFIQLVYEETLVKTSGIPIAHIFVPKETIPII